MIFKALWQKTQTNPELAQASMRVAISGTIMIVLFFSQYVYPNFIMHILLASSLYFLFSILWFVSVYKDFYSFKYRRLLGIFSDLAILSYGIHDSDLVAISLYPLILWVIVINGLRFGSKYLYIALGFALVLFQLATYGNPVWKAHEELIWMFSAGMIALPMFVSNLLNKMGTLDEALIHKANDLEYRLYHDSMTDLLNREALNKELEEQNFYAITLIDINNFSHFNDLYGMDVGNTILKNLAKFLMKITYKQGFTVYRIGGDTFVLLQKDEIDDDALNTKNFTILEDLSNCHMSVSKIKIKINFTIVTVKEKEKALEKANMTLHYARQWGEKYWVYDESINRQDEVENILFWEREIHDAIKDDRIVPVFHPIVDRDGKIVKYETLMRMEKMTNGKMKLFSPVEFLEISMKTNQYEKLTTIMIEKSFKAMDARECDFSINLTFSNIQNKEMVMFLKSQIDKYSLGNRLILEIVESEDIYNFEIVKTFVSYLRLLGVRFAIDDFGSGYSNYMHLFEVMPEYIKIDGSLIQSIDKDENAQKFVESIVMLAKNLGIKTIAEFVHNKAIFEITNALGVDEFQGSYFYKPQTLGQL